MFRHSYAHKYFKDEQLQVLSPGARVTIDTIQQMQDAASVLGAYRHQ